MAPEEPKVRIHVEFGTDHALAVFPARFGNLADAVEHQHRRQRQLCVAWAKHLTAAARQQILVFVTAAPIQHLLTLSQNPDGAFSSEMDPFRPGSAPVIMDRHTTARNCPAAIGARLCRDGKVKSGRSLSYSPADGKAPRRGKPRHPLPGSLVALDRSSCEKLASNELRSCMPPR